MYRIYSNSSQVSLLLVAVLFPLMPVSFLLVWVASEWFPASEGASVAAAPPGVCRRAAPSKKPVLAGLRCSFVGLLIGPTVGCCLLEGLQLFIPLFCLLGKTIPEQVWWSLSILFVLVSHICQPWVEVAEDVLSPVCRDVAGGIPKEP